MKFISKKWTLVLLPFLLSTQVFAGMGDNILPSTSSRGSKSNTVSSTNVAAEAGSNLDYIKASNESSVDMLIKASAKYRDGSITKDQYIQVALQVSQMAEYYNQTKGLGSGSGSGINFKTAAATSVIGQALYVHSSGVSSTPNISRIDAQNECSRINKEKLALAQSQGQNFYILYFM